MNHTTRPLDGCQGVDTFSMSTHKLFVANAVFPRFSSTPSKYRNFGSRADDIAALVKKSGADCATFGEMGYNECKTLASHLSDWQYDRAQGSSRPGTVNEGLNSVWSKESVWSQPEDRVSDYNMPSGGQWQRTLILCRLIEKAKPKAGYESAFVTVGAFHETLGNAAKMQYTKAMVDKVGDRRVILGGDFPRTDDDDDLLVMKKAGFVVHERVSATPMTCFTQGSVRVTDVDHLENSKVFDHGYLVVTFSIADKLTVKP